MKSLAADPVSRSSEQTRMRHKDRHRGGRIGATAPCSGFREIGSDFREVYQDPLLVS